MIWDMNMQKGPGLWTPSPPTMCIYNQWQIMLGSSAYFLCVMFESEMETVVRETKETSSEKR